MSLINQALRKAQNDRTPRRMSDPGSAPATSTGSPSLSGAKPMLFIGLLIAVAVLIGLVGGLSVVLFKGDDSPPVASQTAGASQETSAQAGSTASTPEKSATAPEVINPAVPSTETAPTVSPMERESSSAVVEELRKAREAAEAKAAAEAEAALAEAKAAEEAAEEAAARAAAEPSQEIIDWLARAQISGVKLSGTNSKVILNGESYAVGEFVNFALGLKVMVIQEKRILFVDENGKKYMKRL